MAITPEFICYANCSHNFSGKVDNICHGVGNGSRSYGVHYSHKQPYHRGGCGFGAFNFLSYTHFRACQSERM